MICRVNHDTKSINAQKCWHDLLYHCRLFFNQNRAAENEEARLLLSIRNRHQARQTKIKNSQKPLTIQTHAKNLPRSETTSQQRIII
ncbi:hypothetical protein A0U89_05540 [Kozakia baliensis]|uniref:Uncharacterized protein n=1 Tax=Kozakia baliensis TaxID=153496 RepID=A0A1D8UT64_9PROT|nr:hypothetical protein A0U89_05540 [Kozakia baliensis]